MKGDEFRIGEIAHRCAAGGGVGQRRGLIARQLLGNGLGVADAWVDFRRSRRGVFSGTAGRLALFPFLLGGPAVGRKTLTATAFKRMIGAAVFLILLTPLVFRVARALQPATPPAAGRDISDHEPYLLWAVAIMEIDLR